MSDKSNVYLKVLLYSYPSLTVMRLKGISHTFLCISNPKRMLIVVVQAFFVSLPCTHHASFERRPNERLCMTTMSL